MMKQLGYKISLTGRNEIQYSAEILHYQLANNRQVSQYSTVLQYVQTLRCMSKDCDFEASAAIDHRSPYIIYVISDALTSGLLYCLLTFHKYCNVST